MLKECLENTKSKGCLIHNITNRVTMNDVANILLASGGRPIMAEEKREVEDITSICQGLYLNIGMVTSELLEAMLLAGKKANALHHPVLLDPVGIGASRWRTDAVTTILDEVKCAIIRGNASEIKAVATGSSQAGGVDSSAADEVTEENLLQAVRFNKDLSKALDAIIICTGKIDLVTYGDKTYVIRNGHERMRDITGTGCMLSALVCAFVCSNEGRPLEAATAAVCAMGVAGQVAYERLQDGEGNSTYRNRIIDAIDCMTGEILEERASYEIL